MSDRLQEIRARLDAWHDMEPVEQSLSHPDEYVADIAWLLDEVERLRNTKASSPNPLCDESVVQDVTKLECSDG